MALKKGTTLLAASLKYIKGVFSFFRQTLLPSLARCFSSRQDVIWVSLVFVMGTIASGFFMTQPMRYDESYTFLQFVNQGFDNMFYYPLPNNHVLHTLLVRLSTLIGGAHPVVMRIPAFLAGLGCIPLLFCLGRKLGTKRSGFLASLSLAVFPFIILYSTMARGYTIQVFLCLVLAYSAICVSERLSLEGSFFMSLISAAGLFTIPSMLFPLAGINLWLVGLLLLKGRSVKDVMMMFVIPNGLLTLVLTLVLYTPVVAATGGVQPIINNPFVQSQPWAEFFQSIGPHLQGTYVYFVENIPIGGVLALAFLFLVGLFISIKRKDTPTALLLPCLLLGSAFFLLLKHRIPFERTWIFMIPFVLVSADVGFSFLTEKLPGQWGRLVRSGIFVIGVIFSFSLMSTDAIAKQDNTGVFPEARPVVEALKPLLSEGDDIDYNVPASSPVRFYMWYLGVPTPEKKSPTKQKFFIIKKSQDSIDQFTQKPVKKIFDLNDAAIYQALKS